MTVDLRGLLSAAREGVHNVVAARIARSRNRHWSIKAAKALTLVSAGAMAVAAATSASDHDIRADGTKGSPDDLAGDPGGKPTDDVGQKTGAGEKTDPDSDANALDESGSKTG